MLTQLDRPMQAKTACVNPVFSGAAATRKHLELLGGDEHKFSVAFSYVNSKTGKTGLSNNGTQYHSGMVVSKAAAENSKGHDCYIIPNAMKPGKPEDNNCVAVRALYIDVDDGRDWAAMTWHAEPSFIVVTERGFHGYWLVSDCTVEQFTTAQKALIQHYNSDKSINNPARLLRLAGTVQHKHGNSYQTSLVVLHGSEKRPLSALLNGLQQENTLSGVIVYPAPIQQRLSVIATAPEGERNTTLFNGTAQLLRDYPNQRDTILSGAAAAGLSAGLSADEVVDTVNRASLSQVARSPQQKEAPRKRSTPATSIVDITAEPLEVVLERALVGVDLDSIGNVQQRNTAVVNAIAGVCQRDVLAGKVRIGGHSVTMTELYAALIDPTRGKLGEEQFLRLLDARLDHNPYYAHADYLLSLASSDDPDATLNGLYEAMGIEPDDTLSRAMVRIWLISAVNRALVPGCHAQYVLTLAGKQRKGKTRFLESLFGVDWVTVASSDDSGKDAQIKQYTAWLVQWDELDQFGKKEAGKVKQYITLSHDQYRAVYARDPLTRPRHFVFAATVNGTGFLKDPTGSRRFFVVPITQKIDVDWVTANRDSVWAAALTLYQAGEKPYPTDAQEDAIDERNETHTEENVWLEPIKQFMETEPGYVTFTRLVTVGLKLTLTEANSPTVKTPISAALHKLGYELKQLTLNGERNRYYVKEGTDPKQLSLCVQQPSEYV